MRFAFELTLHFLIAAILGFLGMLPAAWIAGPELLGPVLVPAALVGFRVGRADFGLHPTSAEWAWAAALSWLCVVWVQSTIYDYRNFWSLFTDGSCPELECVGQYFVTAPFLAATSYSVAARVGRRR